MVNYYGAVANRCDYEFKWLTVPNFTPARGEFVIFAKEADDEGNLLVVGQTTETVLAGTDRDFLYTYDRIKLGDGVTPIMKLPFVVTDGNGSSGISGVTDSVAEEEGIGADWIYRKWKLGIDRSQGDEG